MANKFVKYTIIKYDDGLYLCRRNFCIAENAPEGYYYKSKSGKILGDINIVFSQQNVDYTFERSDNSELIPEEEVELVKEDEE